jgi:hypothetical protein
VPCRSPSSAASMRRRLSVSTSFILVGFAHADHAPVTAPSAMNTRRTPTRRSSRRRPRTAHQPNPPRTMVRSRFVPSAAINHRPQQGPRSAGKSARNTPAVRTLKVAAARVAPADPGQRRASRQELRPCPQPAIFRRWVRPPVCAAPGGTRPRGSGHLIPEHRLGDRCRRGGPRRALHPTGCLRGRGPG